MRYVSSDFDSRFTIASLFIAAAILITSIRIIQLSVFRSEEISKLVLVPDREWNVPLRTAQDRLDDVIKNIDNMTLAEIRASISEAREFLQHLQSEQRENLRALDELRLRLAEESTQVSSLESQRKTLESLKEQSVEALSYLLARDAKKDKWSSFLLGALLSFPIGVAASLLASVLFNYFSGRKPRKASKPRG